MGYEQNPQPGVDYIVDYYSVLGVDRNAGPPLIRKKYREKIVQYHPDKYQGLAPELQVQAVFQARILTEASETLSDLERRKIYDRQLAEWQGPVSKNGTPIVDLSRTNTVLNLLLDSPGSNEQLQRVLDYVQQMSGFDPVIFQFLEQQYDATEKPSPELEKAYREALARKDTFLILQESFRRDDIGLDGSSAMDSSPNRGYLDKVSADINNGRAQIATAVEQIVFQLQSGEISLLGAGQIVAEAVAKDPSQALAVYKQKIAEQYDLRAAEIERLAAQRQEVIEKRLKLARGEYLFGQGKLSEKLIVNFEIGDEKRWFAFHIEDNSVTPDPDLSPEVFAEMDDPEHAKAMVEKGYSVMRLIHQDGLPISDELKEAVGKHYDSL